MGAYRRVLTNLPTGRRGIVDFFHHTQPMGRPSSCMLQVLVQGAPLRSTLGALPVHAGLGFGQLLQLIPGYPRVSRVIPLHPGPSRCILNTCNHFDRTSAWSGSHPAEQLQPSGSHPEMAFVKLHQGNLLVPRGNNFRTRSQELGGKYFCIHTT